MTTEALTNVLREALYLALLLSLPPLLAMLATGVVMGLVQSALRIEERTLSIVPRLLAAMLALAVAAPWIGAELVRFTGAVLAAVPSLGRT